MNSGPKTPRRFDNALAQRGGLVECLRLPASLFAFIARTRARFYERGLFAQMRLDTPVISVGNLSVGGTGKTPMSLWLARQAHQRGLRAGILSRGYKAGSGGTPGRLNDEGQLIAEILPDVPQVQDPDRVRGGEALQAQGVDWIVLDDGFQHRRLVRDLDLVLVDATRPWGLPPAEPGARPVCATLPRGFLREPPLALRRADQIVLTRADSTPPGDLQSLREELRRIAPDVEQVLTSHRPSGLRIVGAGSSQKAELDQLRDVEVDVISAIGNPGAFEETVRQQGAQIVRTRHFPDHHAYSTEDLMGLGDRPLVTTAKDAVKLAGLDCELWVLDVELCLIEGEELLAARLDALPQSQARRERLATHEGLHG